MENLLLEIGSEEIPAGYIRPALNALSEKLLQRLDDARIDHGDAMVYGTPRRLAIVVKNVASKQKSVKSELVGPPANIGFDGDGKPTMAAIKFAEKAGVAVNALRLTQTSKGEYLCAHRTQRGIAASKLLKDIFPGVILSIPFPKKMRWADLSIEFARPILNIVALLGQTVIPFKLGNLKAGRFTSGHSFMAPGKIKLDNADDYVDALRRAHVLVDLEERKAMLEREILKVAEKLGGSILPDQELVDIVNNLVEYPIPVAGRFDQEFLEVPDEVLINAMREHQKYFAVVDGSGKLMPCFIAVNNTQTKDLNIVAKGHERVLRARLADAQFFYHGDLEITGDERVEKLKGVLFQAELGSMYEKIERVGAVAEFIAAKSDAKRVAADDGLKNQVLRAARLCKSDLVTQVVGEFPKLQGIMGRVYAAAAGEHPDIASAIEEHYRPVFSGAPLPATRAGAILGIADKIDSICGCFSVGLIPTGASDPYALRRQGIGLIQIILDQGFTFSLSELIEESLNLFRPENSDAVSGQVYGFLKNRMTGLLAEDGHSKDTIAAVLSLDCDNIPEIWSRVAALENLKAKPDFEPLAVAFKRVVNIIKKADDFETAEVNPDLFEDDSEPALLAAYESVKKNVEDDLANGLFDQALLKVATLRDAVDTFFEGVMVLADDKNIRRNRLSLLGRIADLFDKFADFSKISV
jgi:glycyl-tRNA synthetase beta chain